MFFFSWVFFSREHYCLVSNCSWRNFQSIGIKFTVLPFPLSCWNIRKKVYPYTYGSRYLLSGHAVKLSDLPVFRRGNHRKTIISKSIVVSYPGNLESVIKVEGGKMFTCTLLLTWCSDIYRSYSDKAVPWTCLLCLIGVIKESVSVQKYVLDAKKNLLNVTVLLRT